MISDAPLQGHDDDRFRAVFDTMSVGIVYQDATGAITAANRAAERILGLSLAQMQGRTSIDPRWRAVRADGADFPGEEHPAMVALRTGECVHGVTMGVQSPAADEQRWIRIDATPLFSRDATSADGVYATFLDITELRRAEDALRESEEKYRGVVERASDGILIAAAGKLVFANQAFAQMSGYSVEELEGGPYLHLFPEDEQAVITDRVRRRLAGEDFVSTYEIDMLRKDGSRFTVEARAGVTTFGNAPANLVIHRDITERKRLERQLDDERQRYRLLFENCGEAILLTQPDGAILSANPEACRMFGSSEEEICEVGRTGLVDVTDPRLAAGLQERAQTGKASGELRFVRSDSTIFLGEISTRVYVDHLGEEKTSMVIRDLTERKAAEAEISRLNAELRERVVSRTEQLDATTRELEALAYSIAHDVRAPLRTIDGFSAMVIADEGERLAASSAEKLQRVRAAAQKLGVLMDDLLGLSKLSRRDLAREGVDVSALAAEVGAELAAEAPARAVALSVQPGMRAEADPRLVRLILRELLDNAWKFSSGCEQAQVEVGALDADGECVFFVRDDGAGFEMDYAAHLFGVFQRMHPQGEFEGDGVGLATVQRLVRRHGGRVWAEAEVENGATFFFTLPAAE
jgi:PAS domain S-box-containing protein